MNLEQTGKITVLICDDHSIVIAGITASFADTAIEVVGEAKTPDDVIKMYFELMPDVLVLDIIFGGKRAGLIVGQQILQKKPDAKIVFISQIEQDFLIKEAYEIGGFAFITKDFEGNELALAVTRAKEGQLYFSPPISERLATLSVRGDGSPQSLLDEREIEFFKLIALGLTNIEIAESIGVSAKTVSNTSQSIKDKLGMHRPAELTRLAVRYGLIES